MNVDVMLKEALREQADSVGPAPGDLADRVLAVRRRRRTGTAVGAFVAATAVVVAAVVVPRMDDAEDAPPADVIGSADVVAHPDQSPPKDAIAAGRTALASFVTYKSVKFADGDGRLTRTYGVLDPTTKTYRKTTAWSWLTVAPGLRTAAVLEKKLPAKRVGILDLATNKVTRWIPVPQGAAGAAFSADGGKLVVTTYKTDPDHLYKDRPMNDGSGPDEPSVGHPSRTGFSIVDLDSGKGKWAAAPQKGDEFDHNAREDFQFSPDGDLVVTTSITNGGPQSYALDGKPVTTPAKLRHWLMYSESGLSPNGKLAGGDFAGKGDKIAVAVNDARTGKLVDRLPAQQLLAWADDKRLIAWGCDPKKCGGKGEFHNQLLLVTVGSDKVVQLSDFRKASADYPGRWEPQFATR
ncbi:MULTISPECIES: WD40 repeat domain-containing protein [unclassified Streptomyces]|uniref:WD40 repeat domain-containing protein n=1 Tax=unclassified Streptomyces TaxID=2593676 RepID=UPI002E16EDA3